MKYDVLSADLLNLVGGKENVSSAANCMTRLRINVRDESLVDYAAIRKVDGVMGIVEGEQVQIVLGPGHAERAKTAFINLSGVTEGTVTDRDVAKETRDKIKAKQQSPIQKALKHVGNIFVPVIPGFIACGLVLAIANIAKTIHPALASNEWFGLLAAMGGLLGGVLHIVVGMNAAKEFSGSPVLGAIAGAFVYAPALAGIVATETDPAKPLSVFGQFNLSPGLGGVIGVILAVFVFAVIERKVRAVVPASMDLFLVPFITLLIGGVITAFIVMPIAAGIMKLMTWLLVDIALTKGGVLGGYVLSATFLPLVMLGIHQGLTPLHAQLIQEVGYTVLLPILAMAGAGQVGSALAIYFKTKDKQLKQTITAGLPIGFLGIGEPLIYGVSLPLGRPFITACLGAGFGGAYVALIGNVGATGLGVSGVLLTPLIAEGNGIHYLIGLVISYIGGAALTWLFGYNDKLLEKLR